MSGEDERVLRAQSPDLGKVVRHLGLGAFERSATAATEECVAPKESGRRAGDDEAEGASRVARRVQRAHREVAHRQCVSIRQRMGAPRDRIVLAAVDAHRREALGEHAVPSRVVPVVVGREDRLHTHTTIGHVLFLGQLRQREQHRACVTWIDEGGGPWAAGGPRAVDDQVRVVVHEARDRMNAVRPQRSRGLISCARRRWGRAAAATAALLAHAATVGRIEVDADRARVTVLAHEALAIGAEEP